jgi:hypothetical protein
MVNVCLVYRGNNKRPSRRRDRLTIFSSFLHSGNAYSAPAVPHERTELAANNSTQGSPRYPVPFIALEPPWTAWGKAVLRQL